MIKKILKNIITFGLVGVVTAGILSGASLKAWQVDKSKEIPQYMNSSGEIENGGIVTQSIYYNFVSKYGQETANAYKQSLITGDYSYIYNALGSTSPVYDMSDVCVTDDGVSIVHDDWSSGVYNTELSIQKVYNKTGVMLTISEIIQLAKNKGWTTECSKINVGYIHPTTYLLRECTFTAADCNAVKNSQAATSTTTSSSTYNLSDYANEFDATYYYNRYPDLQKAIGNDAQALLEHWINYGKAEGRIAKAQ